MRKLSWLSAFVFAVGCAGESIPRGEIEGDVMLPGGRPLPTGIIRFLPVEDTTDPQQRESQEPGRFAGPRPTAFAEIKDGKYRLDTAKGPAVGKNRVEITALRKSGEKIPVPDGPPGQFQEVEEQYVPARYNVASQVFVEIAPGQNKKDFTLGPDRLKP